MKLRSLLFTVAFFAVFGSSSLALAQTAPAAPVGVTLSTQTAIVTIIALVAGFVGQAVNSGNFFGIVTTPKAWIPYLTILGSFLAAVGLSLQSAPALNGAAWFNAIIAGFMALTSAGAGAAVHGHLNSHKKSGDAGGAAAASPAAPPAAPTSEGGK